MELNDLNKCLQYLKSILNDPLKYRKIFFEKLKIIVYSSFPNNYQRLNNDWIEIHKRIERFEDELSEIKLTQEYLTDVNRSIELIQTDMNNLDKNLIKINKSIIDLEFNIKKNVFSNKTIIFKNGCLLIINDEYLSRNTNMYLNENNVCDRRFKSHYFKFVRLNNNKLLFIKVYTQTSIFNNNNNN
jgi:hypothetical protein